MTPPVQTEPSPSMVYRDATFTRETRDKLAEIFDGLTAGHGFPANYITAVGDVVDRWDANEATEFYEDTDGVAFTETAERARADSNLLAVQAYDEFRAALGEIREQLDRIERGERG